MHQNSIAIYVLIIISFLCLNSNVSADQVDSFGQSVPDNFNQRIEDARLYRLPYSGKYDPNKSIEIINQLVAERQDYYRGYFNLGLAYGELKEFSKAQESFSKALEIRAKLGLPDTTIFNSAGWVCMNAGNIDCAKNYFEQAISENRDTPNFTTKAAYNNLGQLYFNAQRFDEAKRYLRIAYDKFGSTAAGDTLKLIDEIEKSRQNTNK